MANDYVQKLLSIAASEIGYLEKATNARLDDKTANAGYNNFTKYARDLDNLNWFYGKKNGFPYCSVWVSWCFYKAFGEGKAKELLYQPEIGNYAAGCVYAAMYFKTNKAWINSDGVPKPGDQIFFKYGTEIGHTGIVESVTASRVCTIEANTSMESGVIPNGGGVCRKSYALNYSGIAGYGIPNWNILEQEDDEDMDISKLTDGDVLALWGRIQSLTAKQSTPAWAENELAEAQNYGITDGTRPMQPSTRMESAIMTKRAYVKALEAINNATKK